MTLHLHKALQAAEGYLELGMAEDALRELNRLPNPLRVHPNFLRAHLQVLMRCKSWEPAVESGRKLCRIDSESVSAFLHTAFCLHEIGRTLEAKELLLSGPEALKAEPTYHYNLACYDAVLGQFDEAEVHLRQSFKMNEDFRGLARIDPDLKAIRDRID